MRYAYERGVKIKYISEITKHNINYCKELMKIAEVRHVDNAKGGMAVSDSEYIATAWPRRTRRGAMSGAFGHGDDARPRRARAERWTDARAGRRRWPSLGALRRSGGRQPGADDRPPGAAARPAAHGGCDGPGRAGLAHRGDRHGPRRGRLGAGHHPDLLRAAVPAGDSLHRPARSNPFRAGRRVGGGGPGALARRPTSAPATWLRKPGLRTARGTPNSC